MFNTNRRRGSAQHQNYNVRSWETYWSVKNVCDGIIHSFAVPNHLWHFSFRSFDIKFLSHPILLWHRKGAKMFLKVSLPSENYFEANGFGKKLSRRLLKPSVSLSFNNERVKSSWNRHWTTNRRPQWLFKHFMVAIPVWNIHSAHKNDPDALAAVFKAFSAEKLPPSRNSDVSTGRFCRKQ